MNIVWTSEEMDALRQVLHDNQKRIAELEAQLSSVPVEAIVTVCDFSQPLGSAKRTELYIAARAKVYEWAATRERPE